MYKLCIFAGTTEGRRLAELLSRRGIKLLACVATDYGEALMEPSENLEISAKRMDSDEMAELFDERRFDLVIDATHPYAEVVTENIILACKRTDTEHLRLIRDESGEGGDALTVSCIDEAVSYLNGTQGNILLTTGSKELAAFSALDNFAERVFARVLPMEDSLALCREAGLSPSHIIAMQGPFSTEMNAATINAVNAAFVVTKKSGRAGGFDEKAAAAKKAGARLVVIGRPKEEQGGLSYSETLKYLEKRFDFIAKPCVAVVGTGMGGSASLTIEADAAIRNAECVIGAKRMLEYARADQAAFEAVDPNAIADYIREHKEFSRFAVLMSGDTGFFSGAKKLLPLLDFCEVTVLAGISSLSYLCAKAGLSYEGVKTVSIHGREANIATIVARNQRVFVLVGGENGAGRLIDRIADAGGGLEKVRVTVGERLGYPDERITSGCACELSDRVFDSLSSVYIENDHQQSAAYGLPDSCFLRSGKEKPIVPMTKSEVRSAALSKLRLLSDSVVWDVGAGTGSVSIEAALTAFEGRVYAIERKSEAAELIRENAESFLLNNISVIEGSAPDVCRELPAPTHAFIGGSSGNMKDIIRLLISKNPNVRIVATAISLETVIELEACVKEFHFAESEVVCMNVSKGNRVGGYTLMVAQNPVYIFTMQNI